MSFTKKDVIWRRNTCYEKRVALDYYYTSKLTYSAWPIKGYFTRLEIGLQRRLGVPSYGKRCSDELSNNHIANSLRSCGISTELINQNPSIIELERLRLKTKRELQNQLK